MSKRTLPTRSEVAPGDCWDLSSLFDSGEEWEKAFSAWEKKLPKYETFSGKLGGDAKTLADCLRFHFDIDRKGERLGVYAFLKTAEDATDDAAQQRFGRFTNAASRAGELSSFIRPEIMRVPKAKMDAFLAERSLAPYRRFLSELLRFRPHTLGRKEERLLAIQAEMSQASNQIFHKLHDADLKFGAVKDEDGNQIEVSHAGFSSLLNASKRSVRKTAFFTHYEQYEAHKHTLAATLAASIQRDVYYARARGHKSSLEAALFPDAIPTAVYDNLLEAVNRRLPSVHAYYDLRRKAMHLKDIHHYDTYVPILSGLRRKRDWEEAVEVILESLAPLGTEYGDTLARGLNGRWCDRYENRGKQSGAFSCGSYDGDPYILMNYKPDVLDHVFTLAHEAGHSMHSYYSKKAQAYPDYDYVLFVAEVASTFNEQLLHHHLMSRADSDEERAFLINRQIDAIRATLVRQTMFAEFEKETHALAEAGEPLTLDRFRSVYGSLLSRYFGPHFTIDEPLSLECFRIPHFYRAFYVYKYATGLSAAIALSRRVLEGGKRELQDYLRFLCGGCSKEPLELLRDAGIDMAGPEPVETALAYFGDLVEELERLL